MSPGRLGLLTALLAGITLAFSALSHVAAGRPGAALVAAAGGLVLAGAAAAVLARTDGSR